MTKYVHKSKYFYGNEISEYGLKNGYVDYSTLAKSFDCVMANGIDKLFFADINGEWNEPEQVNGFVDNSDEIEELQEKIEELQAQLELEEDEGNEDTADEIRQEIEELEQEIEELENPEQPEIFQYFIISQNGAEILQDLTDEIVYYLPAIDCYVWGITHWGTAWNGVLTDIKIELDEE